MLVDDHPVFRAGLKALIEQNLPAEVVAEAADGLEFLEKLPAHLPDLVLMDIEMPRMNGIEATHQAVAQHSDLKVLVLSMLGDEDHYYRMIQAGAKGFILKKSKVDELGKAINEVAAGNSYFSPELLTQIVISINKHRKADPVSFSDREEDVLRLICKGLSNEEIAGQINLSVSSIKSYKSSLFAKTRSKNTADLIIFAIKNKIVEL